MSHQSKRIYEFGHYRLDGAERLLLRDGNPIPLQPKVFDLLLALVDAHGHLLEKDELLKTVWPDTLVEEANLASNISLLRKALGEGENGHRYIETVPKRGYRFVAQVRAAERVGERVVEGQPAAQSLTVNAEQAAKAGEIVAPLTYASSMSPSKTSRRRRGLIPGLIALGVVIAAVAYATSFIRQKPRAEQPALRPLSQLTYGAGLQGEPTWGPDGRMIAYSSDRSGNFDIWVQQVNGGDPINVTKSPEHDWQPDLSPDGMRIVFRSERDGGGLFIVPTFGGSVRKISSFGYCPRWSPDGSRILFFDYPFRVAGETKKAYIASLDGESPHEVQSEFLSQFIYFGVRCMAWHPDGQRISVWGEHSKDRLGFWTMPLTGGAPLKSEIPAEIEKLLNDAISLEKFQWAPSGQYLYFEGKNKSVRNLWRVMVDPQTLRWVTGPERLTTDIGLDTDLALSRDGKKLAYTIRAENRSIWSLPFDAATGQIKGARQPIATAAMNPWALDLSRDGKKLSLNAQRAGKYVRLEKSLEDGQEKLLATEDNSVPNAGFWSRDGTHLVCRRGRLIGPVGSNLYEVTTIIYPAGGGDEQALTSPTTSNDCGFDWTADGQWVLSFANPRSLGSGRSRILLLPVAAAPHAETQAREVTSSEEYNMWSTRLSPNERWISFNAVHKDNKDHTSTVYVVPTSGGAWTRITEGKYWDDIPHWSPDGKTIYFSSNRTGFFNVWGIRFNPDTGKPVGEPFRVTNFEGLTQMYQSNGHFAMSANRLVITLKDVSGNIWVLDNVDR